MKFNKKEKGWILEELEKKNECLDANSFGGENPEEVEKQREEKDKEINKRFDATKKNADKVVGEDHEEKGKPMKEYLEDKKSLGNLITYLKKEDIHYTIKKSDIDGYRFLVEYLANHNSFAYRGIKVQFLESKNNYMIHFGNGELVEAQNKHEAKNLINEKLVEDDVDFEKVELPEDEPLPDAIPDEPIVISTEVPEEVEDNAIYMALSSELRDTLLDIENLKSLVVTVADSTDDAEVINSLNSIIDDRTIHSGLLQGLMDKFNTKVETTEEENKDDIEVTLTDEEEVKQESLNEEVEGE